MIRHHRCRYLCCMFVTTVCPSAFTAEQYQQHQEQLALMQKEQLELIQLQQQANSTATANSTHVSFPGWVQLAGRDPTPRVAPSHQCPPPQGLPNTLDQASAQFAASALVTADQLLALKTKEELGPGGGVNGVLSPSGTVTPQPTTLSAGRQPLWGGQKKAECQRKVENVLMV